MFATSLYRNKDSINSKVINIADEDASGLANSSTKKNNLNQTQQHATQSRRWASHSRNDQVQALTQGVDGYDAARKKYEQIQLNHDTSDDSVSNKKSRREMKDSTTVNTTKNTTTQKGFQKTR